MGHDHFGRVPGFFGGRACHGKPDDFSCMGHAGSRFGDYSLTVTARGSGGGLVYRGYYYLI